MINPRYTLDDGKQTASGIRLLTSGGSGLWGSGLVGTVADPAILYAGPAAGQIWSVTRIILHMQQGTTETADLGHFWRNGATLTNGILFRKTINGILDHYLITDPIKTAMEMLTCFHDVKSYIYPTSPYTAGDLDLTFHWISEDAGYSLWLDGDKGERVEWVIQDTMPSGGSWVAKMTYERIK